MRKIQKHHILGFIFLTLLFGFIIGRFIKEHHNKSIYIKGQKGICFVYGLKISSREGAIHRGQYYFFIRKHKYYGESIIPNNRLNPVNKYFEIYYIEEFPNENIVDYSKEITNDSLNKYFLNAQNPFKNERK